MEDEEFKLSKSNIVMIVITSVLSVILIVTSIILIISFMHPIEPLPNLEITQGKTSTINPKTTTSTTPPTTTTTQKVYTESPYYNINANEILNDPLFEKANLTQEEAEIIVQKAYDFMNAFMNISDNSLFNVSSVIENAKANEEDKITIGDKNYGQIYKYDEFKNRIFTMNYELIYRRSKYGNYSIFVEKNNKLYRIENIIDNVEIVTASMKVEITNASNIEGTIRYYLSNYKEQGYSAPVYKENKISLVYEQERWKINAYDFPVYDR